MKPVEFGSVDVRARGRRFHHSIPVLQHGVRIGDLERTYKTRAWRAAPDLASAIGEDSVYASTAAEARRQCASALDLALHRVAVVRPDALAARREAEAVRDRLDRAGRAAALDAYTEGGKGRAATPATAEAPRAPLPAAAIAARRQALADAREATRTADAALAATLAALARLPAGHSTPHEVDARTAAAAATLRRAAAIIEPATPTASTPPPLPTSPEITP